MKENLNYGVREITIYNCGHEQCAPGHFFGPAVRSHYLMHVVLKGRGIYRAGEMKWSLKAGEAFLIKPHEVTYYRADETEPWEYSWVAFAGAERLLEEYCQEEKGYIYRLREGEEWKLFMARMVNAFLDGGHNKEELTGWFYLLFSCFLKGRKDEKEYELRYLSKAEGYIRHNYSYPIRVGDVARHVGIDRTYLYKLFMRYKGISPKRFLTACRIGEAKRLLENTALSVTETGLSCGFHEASVFCKCFQQMEGKSPLQYRRGVREGKYEE